jgi:hypothetical protein
MSEQRMMKDISLNTPITVTAPAHIWLAFIAAYNACDWANDNATYVLGKAIREIMDPIYLNEQEAAAQEAHDQQEQLFQHLSSHLPGMNPEGPDDDQLK